MGLLLVACEPGPAVPAGADAGVGMDAKTASDLGLPGSDAAVPPTRCLSYSPSAYFYAVTLGRTEMIRFAIKNTCRDPRRILSVHVVEGDGVFELGPLPLPFTLDFEGVLRIPVRFSPLEPRSYEAQVAITFDDPEQPEVRVRVSGEGVGGELRLLPSRMELETTVVGCRSAPRSVALWNEGPGPMYLYSIELEGPDASAFSLHSEAPLPRDVPSSAALSVALGFAPTRAGRHEATVLVRYNGRQSPARVHLYGDAVTSSLREERFTLPSEPRHDLIFLVPPASFQRGERAALLEFLRRVNAEQAVDLRLIVTPIGARDAVMGEPVACPGFEPVLDIRSIDRALLDVLVPCMFSVARSEGDERGSGVMVSALERSFVAPLSDVAPLGADAVVHVLFTTPQDMWRVPIPVVLSFLDALPRAQPLTLLAHGYDYPAPGQPAAGDARYHQIIEFTGGSFVDQSSDAWTRFFDELHLEMRDGWRPVVPELRPIAETLEVLEASTGSTVGYELDANRGRLRVPALGGLNVMLRYDAACGL